MKQSKPPKALVVDDNAVQNEISIAVLRKFGFQTEAVTTSKDFIQRLKEIKPDLCLVDLNIEALGVGFTIIKAVRNVLGAELPLFVVSGRYDADAVSHAMEIGADDFLSKPLDREVLATKISRYIQTDAILSSKSNLFPVPDGGMAASLSLELEISMIDESGIQFLSPHLLSKGTVIPVDSSLIHELTARSQPLLLAVQSCSYDRTKNSHWVYAEYQGLDEPVRTSIRKWLSKR